ncbi:23S rRNA (adenine(2503)-C(2))-methyltransferase RlmN [Helicobacter sp. MIT 00-7814]|uniref:23S rRNA (adenine(2503)-C(2))-methyltransferase RlmN n=1 Tax=unclassified Helicobacter TaxID=2593540 RepID=UPI0026CEBB07
MMEMTKITEGTKTANATKNTSAPKSEKSQNIFSYTLDELAQIFQPKFRAKQIYKWLYVYYKQDFLEMSDLPKDLRQNLAGQFCAKNLEILKVEESKDGSKKYLFKTKDGYTFESVLLKMKEKLQDEDGKILNSEKWSICVSSQVGCKVGCAFCFTAKGGFQRDLESGEIVEQIVQIKAHNEIPPQKRVNIVYMGMGEPLDNLENVTKAIRILSELDGLSISARRQTISTSGIAPKIRELGKLNLGVQLAISLHAVDDKLRSALIPMNRKYNIQQVLDEVRKFPIDLRKRVMFEYLMIKDLNDSLKEAKKLLSLLNGIRSKVNVILFNPHEGSKFGRPSMEKAREFADFLTQKGLLCTIRESKGLDISAACGQLREKEKDLSADRKIDREAEAKG